MRYVVHTENEKQEMLAALGLTNIKELFSDIDESLSYPDLSKIPLGKSEVEILRDMSEIANLNKDVKGFFVGGGIYRHYIPSVVSHLVSRSEFYTAYTPYQAEMSQGMLTAIFEYQTAICRLTGMDISNASLYDGATAAAEAAFLAVDTKKKKKVAVLGNAHPDTIEVLKTYCHTRGYELSVVGVDAKSGRCDMDSLKAVLDGAACLIAQSPNFYGIYENMDLLSSVTHESDALFIASVNPTSLAIVNAPSEYNADVVVGDGQPLGIPMQMGAPSFGFFATTSKLTRRIPGRIVGKTTDHDGKDAYVLTLQAREQHIRRDKAFSNICSNHSLSALTGLIYLAAMSHEGLRNTAIASSSNAHDLCDVLLEYGFVKKFSGEFFHEFVVEGKCSGETLRKALLAHDIAVLSLDGEGMENCTMWCATEMTTATELLHLKSALDTLKKEGTI